MIRFTIRQLEYFQMVLETGSATAAAKACHVSQAGLSAGIAQLEVAVGVQLFVRQKSRNLSLTPAGQAFSRSVQSILQQLQELGDGASNFGREISGTLRLGCFDTLSPMLLPALAQYFTDEHPKVSLRFFEGAPQEIEANLRAGRCEAIVVHKQHVSRDLKLHSLGSHPLYLALPPNHPLASESQVHLEQLADDPFVLLDQEPIATLATNVLREHGVESEPLLTSRSIETIRSFVARGLGFTLTGVRPPNDVSFEGLPIVFKKLSGGAELREIVVCTMPDSPLSKRLQVSIEFWRNMFAEMHL